MSQGSVEVVRRIYAAFASGDFQVALAALDPGIEWRAIEDTETRHGVHGVSASLASWLETWEDHRVEPEGEFIEVGNHVLVSTRLRGRGRQSGAEVENRYFSLWTIREGRVVTYREYATKAEALEAAGLRE
jgi:ketosteroid isomerase-like protein